MQRRSNRFNRDADDIRLDENLNKQASNEYEVVVATVPCLLMGTYITCIWYLPDTYVLGWIIADYDIQAGFAGVVNGIVMAAIAAQMTMRHRDGEKSTGVGAFCYFGIFYTVLGWTGLIDCLIAMSIAKFIYATILGVGLGWITDMIAIDYMSAVGQLFACIFYEGEDKTLSHLVSGYGWTRKGHLSNQSASRNELLDVMRGVGIILFVIGLGMATHIDNSIDVDDDWTLQDDNDARGLMILLSVGGCYTYFLGTYHLPDTDKWCEKTATVFGIAHVLCGVGTGLVMTSSLHTDLGDLSMSVAAIGATVAGIVVLSLV